MIVEVCLDTEPRGYASYEFKHDTVTLYLNSIHECMTKEFPPFADIETFIEELVIHETIHIITNERKDEIVDRWHIVLCHLDKERKDCKYCLCFWKVQCH